MTRLSLCLLLAAGICASGLQAEAPARQAREWGVEEHPTTSSLAKRVNLRAVAQEGLRHFAGALKADNEPGTLPEGFPLHIQSLEELDCLTLGLGYQVHTVAPDKVMGSSALEAHVVGTDNWHFLVMSQGHPVGILEVAKVNGKWEAASIGSADLAKDVHDMSGLYANAADFRFIRVFQATSDLMEVRASQGEAPRYAPLVAARHTLRVGRPQSFEQIPTAEDIVPQLREAIQKGQDLKY